MARGSMFALVSFAAQAHFGHGQAEIAFARF